MLRIMSYSSSQQNVLSPENFITDHDCQSWVFQDYGASYPLSPNKRDTGLVMGQFGFGDVANKKW